MPVESLRQFSQIDPGLVYVTKADFSAVASVSVNGCFTSAYENYRLIVSYVGTADHGLFTRLRASSSDRTGAAYNCQRFIGDGAVVASTASDGQTALTYIGLGYDALNANIIDVFKPAVASSATSFVSSWFCSNYNAIGGSGGIYTTADANDGITLYPHLGTITGSLYVYGYRKA